MPEERRQLSKIFPLSFCNSDSIEGPTGKDETQKSSVSHCMALVITLYYTCSKTSIYYQHCFALLTAGEAKVDSTFMVTYV